MLLAIGTSWILVNVAAVLVLAGLGTALKRGPLDGLRSGILVHQRIKRPG